MKNTHTRRYATPRRCFIRFPNTENRRELKIRRAAREYFWMWCLDSRWNTVSSVWDLLNRNKNNFFCFKCFTMLFVRKSQHRERLNEKRDNLVPRVTIFATRRRPGTANKQINWDCHSEYMSDPQFQLVNVNAQLLLLSAVKQNGLVASSFFELLM